MKYLLILLVTISTSALGGLKDLSIEQDNHKRTEELEFRDFLKSTQKYNCESTKWINSDKFHLFLYTLSDGRASSQIFDLLNVENYKKIFFNGSRLNNLITFKTGTDSVREDAEFDVMEKKLYVSMNPRNPNGFVANFDCKLVRK